HAVIGCSSGTARCPCTAGSAYRAASPHCPRSNDRRAGGSAGARCVSRWCSLRGGPGVGLGGLAPGPFRVLEGPAAPGISPGIRPGEAPAAATPRGSHLLLLRGQCAAGPGVLVRGRPHVLPRLTGFLGAARLTQPPPPFLRPPRRVGDHPGSTL